MITLSEITNNGCWVVDRKISMGLIFAIFVHVIAMTTWIARLENRVEHIEGTVAAHEKKIDDMQKMAVNVESMRTDISWIRETIARISSGGK